MLRAEPLEFTKCQNRQVFVLRVLSVWRSFEFETRLVCRPVSDLRITRTLLRMQAACLSEIGVVEDVLNSSQTTPAGCRGLG